MEKGHWGIDASATLNASQWFQYSNGRLKPCISSPAVIQTNFSLAWEVVPKYVHGRIRIMKPLCHWFIKLLTLRTKCSNHLKLFFFFFKMTQLVDDNFIVIQCSIGIKFSTSLALHCEYVNGFSRSKMKKKTKRLAIQERIDESCMRTKSWPYPLFSKSRLGAIRL